MFICELLKSCNVHFQIACLTYCNRDAAAPLTPNPFPQMTAFYKCWWQTKAFIWPPSYKFSFTESIIIGFSGGSDGKKSACNAGDLGSMPGSGRFPGEGNGNPLQYSCLENPMDGDFLSMGLQRVGHN